MNQTLPSQFTSLESEVIRLAPFAIVVCDEQGVIRFANPKAEQLFGDDSEAEFSIVGSDLKALVSEIDYRSTKSGAIGHVLPAQGKRPSLVVHCEKLDVAKGQWTSVYLTEAEQRRERELILEKEASTDELSGLANRRAFQRMMEGNHHKALSLAFLDIDYFKSVNDVHGHLKGDEVIRHVSNILTSVFDDESMLVSRMGGDEFSVLFETLDADKIIDLLNQFRSSVANSKITGSTDINVSMSIGAVISNCPRVGSRNLLTEADRQLYLAKAAGRNYVSHTVLDHTISN